MVKKSPNEKIFVPNEKNFVRTLLGKSPNVKKYVMDVKNYVRTFLRTLGQKLGQIGLVSVQVCLFLLQLEEVALDERFQAVLVYRQF